MIKKSSSYFWLLLTFTVAEFFIHPVDDFPLNDDWSYAHTVSFWLCEGKIDLGYWPAMTLLSHVFWGKIVCQAFGFSHFVLRISTMILSLLSVFMTYNISLRIGKDKKAAFMAALFLCFNPLFFSLSNTFMTDVPFLFSFLLCAFFAERYIHQRKWYWMLGLVAACIYSLLMRQFALAIPTALAAYSFIEFTKRNYVFALSFWLPLIICIPTFYLFCSWSVEHRPAYSSFVTNNFIKEIEINKVFSQGIDRFREMCLMLGLFLFPFLMTIFLRIIREIKVTDLLWMCIPFLIMFWTISKGELAFPSGNIFFVNGIGPDTLYDVMFLKLNMNHSSPSALGGAVFFLSRAGLLFLLINLSYYATRFFRKKSFKEPEKGYKIFLVLLMICYLGFVCLSKSFFDRYLIPCLAVAILFFATWPVEKKTLIATIVAYGLLTGAFSLLGTRDYFEWNRARYSLINETIKAGVDPHDINGGIEYIAYRFYDTPWWPFWESNSTPYYIGFGNMPGYGKEKYVSYQRLIPYQKDTLFLLKKEEPKGKER